jgi:hypothetical protein
MARFGTKQPSAGEHWTEVTAEIRDVKYGLVHTTTTGIDGTYERHEASKKVTLWVDPDGGQAYEATVKIERGGPLTPDVPGTRFQVLVDPSDPQKVALPPDPTFTLPSGGTWRPEHGLAGAIAEASRRGDTKEIMRLTAEAQRAGGGAPATGAAQTRSPEDETLGQLEKLGKLHDSGVLTDEEFNAQKPKILGTG